MNPNPNQVLGSGRVPPSAGLGLGSERRRHLVEGAGEPRDEARVARRGREGTAAAALLPEPCAQVRKPVRGWRAMAAPAGTERSRPAASEPINGSAGAAAERIHAASAGVVAAAAAAPASPCARRFA